MWKKQATGLCRIVQAQMWACDNLSKVAMGEGAQVLGLLVGCNQSKFGYP